MQHVSYDPCNISSKPTSEPKCLLYVGSEASGKAGDKGVSVVKKERVLVTSRSRVPLSETVGENKET